MHHRPSAALAHYVLLLLLALMAAVLGMRSAARAPLRLQRADLGLSGTPTTRRRAPAAAVVYVGLILVAINATLMVLGWCGVHGTGAVPGVAPGRGALSVETFHSAVAGLVEEPVLLALPIALGRRASWPWPLTLAVMIAMRISFHLYYGWDSLFVSPWIVGAFLLYRWCPLLWPFVAHGLFDVLETVRTYGTSAGARAASDLVFATIAVLGVVVATAVIWPRLRTYAREQSAGRITPAVANESQCRD